MAQCMRGGALWICESKAAAFFFLQKFGHMYFGQGKNKKIGKILEKI